MKEYSKGGDMAQNWEYKFLKGERKLLTETNQVGRAEIINKIYGKELTWSEDGKPLNNSTDIVVLSNSWGLLGWELVTILPRSLAESAKTSGTSGTTTEELWVFKRPKK